MDNYTINCTEAQTKKALELGAPIHVTPMVDFLGMEIGKSFFLNDGDACWFPTAEQMIGWLEVTLPEEKDIAIEYKIEYQKWCYFLGWRESELYNSRKEATLAAIDASLEYLTNKK